MGRFASEYGGLARIPLKSQIWDVFYRDVHRGPPPIQLKLDFPGADLGCILWGGVGASPSNKIPCGDLLEITD